MTNEVTDWTNLITSEHNTRPKFMAMIAATLQPLADSFVLVQNLYQSFDKDTAVGAQLDIVGKLVGASRTLQIPLTGVYFSFDTVGLGWDQGSWWNPTLPLTQLTSLSDTQFRTLINAKIASNSWDGTIPGAYTIWNALFAGTGIGILIQDYSDMTMGYALTGPVPDAVTLALFQSGVLSLRPDGVRIRYFMTPNIPNTPYFGFDIENSAISGWDVGQWGTLAPGM